MRVRKLTTFAALAVAASLSLTACNGDDVASGDSSSASSSSSGGGSDQGGSNDTAGKDSGGEKPAPAGKDSAGSGSGSGSGQSGTGGKCRTDDLNITASDSTIDGDTDGSVAVTFENGGADCTLSGFAGVDLKTSEGDLSATRTGQGASPMTLKSGKSVSFSVGYPVNDSGGSGVRVTSLVVTPPGETKSFSVEWPGSGTLPVTDGSGSPVKVFAIGSAGQGGAQ
ncbi:DUF4232 domain-containing protein [Streptomyces kanamyceticus]|uniref:DUF4232 domain-containing protein n=1 Tax=Streptomyces kanamyceticus TaxID=1967 RepID=A0A5J6GGU3_STRKN|nr:DUF4232 domain-containing protein [Streptomyces kanamyceticus]QEU94333.1 DUF4232 domain-containing protein [Streptomyces kanamyceticus]